MKLVQNYHHIFWVRQKDLLNRVKTECQLLLDLTRNSTRVLTNGFCVLSLGLWSCSTVQKNQNTQLHQKVGQLCALQSTAQKQYDHVQVSLWVKWERQQNGKVTESAQFPAEVSGSLQQLFVEVHDLVGANILTLKLKDQMEVIRSALESLGAASYEPVLNQLKQIPIADLKSILLADYPCESLLKSRQTSHFSGHSSSEPDKSIETAIHLEESLAGDWLKEFVFLPSPLLSQNNRTRILFQQPQKPLNQILENRAYPQKIEIQQQSQKEPFKTESTIKIRYSNRSVSR